MKFDFSKSNESDFRNKLQLNKLDILNKNMLYITHMEDKILKILNQMVTDKGLQKQVDDYFEEDAEEKAEEVPPEMLDLN